MAAVASFDSSDVLGDDEVVFEAILLGGRGVMENAVRQCLRTELQGQEDGKVVDLMTDLVVIWKLAARARVMSGRMIFL